jgi:DnaJ like chaperone protein
MGWFGKVVGGAIGFALGGPLGAVLGTTFGHAYDQNVKFEGTLENRRSGSLSSGEQSQATFFVASFSMLAKIAQADGQVTQEEVDSIERFMLEDLRLDPQSRQVAMNIFYAATRSPETFEGFAGQFYSQFSRQSQLLDLMIDILFRVSLADGQMSANEERLIISASKIFRFSDAHYVNIKSRYVTDSERFYAVLSCSRKDSDEAIKSRYRKLVREYHPDTIASKGLPEEFITFANEKFREIQESYEAVKKERGIK